MGSISGYAIPSLSQKSDCTSNISGTPDLDFETLDHSNLQDNASVLQGNLDTLCGTSSHITRLIMDRSSMPAWALAGILFDEWIADHQEVI
jgi:hypothetical protein